MKCSDCCRLIPPMPTLELQERVGYASACGFRVSPFIAVDENGDEDVYAQYYNVKTTSGTFTKRDEIFFEHPERGVLIEYEQFITSSRQLREESTLIINDDGRAECETEIILDDRNSVRTLKRYAYTSESSYSGISDFVSSEETWVCSHSLANGWNCSYTRITRGWVIEYEKDDDGNFVLDDDGFRIPVGATLESSTYQSTGSGGGTTAYYGSGGDQVWTYDDAQSQLNIQQDNEYVTYNGRTYDDQGEIVDAGYVGEYRRRVSDFDIIYSDPVDCEEYMQAAISIYDGETWPPDDNFLTRSPGTSAATSRRLKALAHYDGRRSNGFTAAVYRHVRIRWRVPSFGWPFQFSPFTGTGYAVRWRYVVADEYDQAAEPVYGPWVSENIGSLGQEGVWHDMPVPGVSEVVGGVNSVKSPYRKIAQVEARVTSVNPWVRVYDARYREDWLANQ